MKITFDGKEYDNSKDFIAAYRLNLSMTFAISGVNKVHALYEPFFEEIENAGGKIEFDVLDDLSIRARMIDVPNDIMDKILSTIKG